MKGQNVNWYLLQTKANGHLKACEHLSRQGFDVFLPVVMKTLKKNGRFIEGIEPLFPGYMFMGTDLEPVPWKSVNATIGVSKAVTLDGKYRPVNSNIIECLKSRCDGNGMIQNMSNITSGDRVKIERGPFSEFICNVEKIADSKRAWVLIDILQKQARAKIPVDYLSKVN